MSATRGVGRGNAPVSVTNFYGELALDCLFSPDGKNLAVVRSQFERDAMLIRGFQ